MTTPRGRTSVPGLTTITGTTSITSSQRPRARGLYLALLPTWGDKWTGRQGRKIFTPANARQYGRWLGLRYRDASNIVWVLGGDRRAEQEWQQEILRAMAVGLTEGDDGRHLITYHPRGGESSSEFFHADAWLDFNLLQSGHARDGTNYDMIAHDYSLQPAKPCVDGEPAYEYPADEMPAERPNNHNGAFEVRRRAYWGVFAGGFGHTYGTHAIWQMHDTGRTPRWGVIRPWHESLDLPGARQMAHLRKLMTSRPFLTRIPDQAIVTASSATTPTDRVQATRDGRAEARDATYMMVYFPGPVTATIDTGCIAAPRLRGWWFDPRSGVARPIGELDMTAHGSSCRPPAKTAATGCSSSTMPPAATGHREDPEPSIGSAVSSRWPVLADRHGSEPTNPHSQSRNSA